MWLALGEAAREIGHRHFEAAGFLEQDARSPPPGPHHENHQAAESERHPAAFQHLERIGAEKHDVERQ